MPEPGQRWYVTRIKMSLPWDAILQNLARRGLSGYVPTVAQQAYYQGKKITIERPLFPTYAFVPFDITVTRWRDINSVIGIIHLLPINAEIPLPVPTDFIEELKSRKTVVDMIETTRRYIENEIVKFIAGPFAEAIDLEQRRARIVSSGPNLSRVAIKSLTRGEILATVPTAHLAGT